MRVVIGSILMRFDRLRLCGFKSFVEPIDIAIEPGLTGVVGPNGCGKSNLVEGLRWLMGASSAKSMRASGMDEVIFAGTTGGRPARQWAEVTLEIDNSERRAPAQFNDADTLTVARRVVRKADGSVSTYTINGKEVRARDVQMLFADASTGATSPALVRQGQISELINAKPTERRRFLEEAAGVTGLAARRHEAQLRLKAAADNLERLDDVIGELDVQSEQLARQARKASKYKTLTEDINEVDHRLTAAKIGSAHRRYTELEGVLTERRAGLADLTSQAASADRHATECLTTLEGARSAERQAATAMTEATAQFRAFENEEALRQHAADERRSTLDRLVQDEAREKALLSEAEDAVRSSTDILETIRRDIDAEGDTQDRLESAVLHAEERATEAETAFEDLSNRVAEQRAEARAADQARIGANRRLAEAQRQHDELAEKIENLPATDQSDYTHAEQETKARREALNEAENSARVASENRTSSQRLAADAEKALQQAQQDLKLLEKEAAILLPLIPKKSEESAQDSLLERIRAPENVRAALASALGDALHAALGEGDHAWTMLGSETVDLPPLPDGLTPLSEHIEAPDALNRCFLSTALIADNPTTDQWQALQPGQAILNHAGDLWRWDGYRRKHTPHGHLEKLLEAAARLKDVETEMEAAVAKHAKAVEASKTATQEADNNEQQHIVAQQALDKAQRAERQSSDQLARIARQQEAVHLKRESLDEQWQAAKTSLTAAQQHSQEIEQRTAKPDVDDGSLDKMRARRDETRQLASRARGQAAEGRREAQRRRETLRQNDAQRTAWQQRKVAATKRLEEIDRQRTVIQHQIDAAETEKAEDGRSAQLELTMEETKRQWERSRDGLAAAEQAANAADKARREIEAHTAAAREALAELTAEQRASREKLEEVLAEAEITLADAEDILRSDLAELRVEDLQKQLAKLERERERLGAVNLLAAEEQVQIEERLETLRHERDDCEEASSQLQNAVNSINREGRQRLLAAFDAVNGHFKELFSTLFGGGEAHLRFVDSDDPLAAGLEIFACPPGKKLQSLSLMSGGEQALTATALIFAAFRTNPAPICVLDEVDAPLDDANVERFCDMLALMAASSSTRFIVVTHHPLTMSRMDRLLGVTMMEQGVSRLFSLNLESARRLAA